jgi:hypothetical protein
MRFDDLVKYILNEAPIVDVELDSEHNRPGRIPRVVDPEYDESGGTEAKNLNLYRNKKYRERLQAETAKNIPFNIKLVLSDTDSDPDSYIGDVGTDSISQQPTEGIITFVTDATGDPAILSPGGRGVWMIGHRLGHALDDYYRDRFVTIILKTLEAKIGPLCNNFKGESIPCKRFHNIDITDNTLKILKDISGMKSVQTGNVNGMVEYVYDLVAQYVMFGKVTFRVGNVLKTTAEANELSQKVTKTIYRAFQGVVGKVIYEIF